MCIIKLKLNFLSTLVLLYVLIISLEFDQYLSVQKEKSKLPLKYMAGYFCRSVYITISGEQSYILPSNITI